LLQPKRIILAIEILSVLTPAIGLSLFARQGTISFLVGILVVIIYQFVLMSNRVSYSIFSLYLDPLSIKLRTLTAVTTLFILMTLSSKESSTRLIKLMLLITLSLVFVFLVKTLIIFYFFFEITLLPIRLIIMGWGYQPERLSATFAILIYTVRASFPLLIILLILINNKVYYLFILTLNMSTYAPSISFYCLIIFIAFLVKLPIFRVHL